MKAIKYKGFTLLELMVAMMTALIVVLATGMVMSMGHRNWNQGYKRANLQRDADYAVLKMSHWTKRANSAVVTDNGNTLTLNSRDGWTRIFFVNGSLESQRQDRMPETILKNKVKDVTFTVNNNLVGIDLVLTKDELETNFVTSIMMRNYGE